MSAGDQKHEVRKGDTVGQSRRKGVAGEMVDAVKRQAFG